MNVVPTNAVAMPVGSRSARTRSIASRTMRGWSKASSSLPFRASDTGGSGVRGVSACGDVADVSQHREVGDRDHVHARVTAGVAVGTELGQQAGGDHAGLLAELAPRGLVERLVGALEATGDRPRPRRAPRRDGRAARADGRRPWSGSRRRPSPRTRELRRVVSGRHSRIVGFSRHDHYHNTVLWSVDQNAGGAASSA